MELQLDASNSHYNYVAPPGLKIYELHWNRSRQSSSDRSATFVALRQYLHSSPIRADL